MCEHEKTSGIVDSTECMTTCLPHKSSRQKSQQLTGILKSQEKFERRLNIRLKGAKDFLYFGRTCQNWKDYKIGRKKYGSKWSKEKKKRHILYKENEGYS